MMDSLVRSVLPLTCVALAACTHTVVPHAHAPGRLLRAQNFRPTERDRQPEGYYKLRFEPATAADRRVASRALTRFLEGVGTGELNERVHQCAAFQGTKVLYVNTDLDVPLAPGERWEHPGGVAIQRSRESGVPLSREPKFSELDEITYTLEAVLVGKVDGKRRRVVRIWCEHTPRFPWCYSVSFGALEDDEGHIVLLDHTITGMYNWEESLPSRG